MKKLLSIILSITMLLSITAGLNISAYALTGSGSCGNNLTYKYDAAKGELVISGTGEMTDFTVSESPFYDSNIKSVIINSGVTSVGGSAFYYCRSLKSVKLPSSLKSIGEWAFRGCSALTDINIPSGVTNIGERAFRECSSLKSITLPSGIKTISYAAFFGCWALTGITIPNGVTSIEPTAFYNCKSLLSVYIPKTVKSIGFDAFRDCKKLKDVYYFGSQKDWKAIKIETQNEYLTGAVIHYNYKYSNSLTVKSKKVTVKYSKLRKKNQLIAQKNAFSVNQAKGKVTYKKTSGNKKIAVSSAGKITVKKGLKKGTYKIKVKITAAGNSMYKSAAKTVKITVIVK